MALKSVALVFYGGEEKARCTSEMPALMIARPKLPFLCEVLRLEGRQITTYLKIKYFNLNSS